MKSVFITGGTGYVGRPLIETLSREPVNVTAVARPVSVSKLPSGCTRIVGDVLDSRSYCDHVPSGCTFVHLVGVSHPAPWKANEFRSIDLVSMEQSLAAAKHAGARHFVFVSVAHPAPVMRSFIQVRMRCEELISSSGIAATILRPWYVLGPGHYWPYALLPFYKLFEAIPATRKGAVRLGLVKRAEVVKALAIAALSPVTAGVHVLETPEIRALPPLQKYSLSAN